MTKTIKYAVLILLVSLFALASVEVQAQAPARYVDNQVIVKIKENAPGLRMASVENSLNARVVGSFRFTTARLLEISGMSVEEAIARYRDNPFIEYIEPNYLAYPSDVFPNDPIFPVQWNLHNTGQTGGTADADIDAPEAWQIETGEEVVVAILDTGVDYEHEDLADNIWINWPEYNGQTGVDDDGNGYIDDIRGWNFANNPDDNDPMDDFGHGTHVAGIVAAAGNNGVGLCGVNWVAKIMPVKFSYSGGSARVSDMALALDYAVEMGAKIANMSWNLGEPSQLYYEALVNARNHGVLYVNSAGNNNRDIDLEPSYPACYTLDNIIAVAATDHNDARYVNYSYSPPHGSNWGAVSVDLAAPGVDIFSTFIGPIYELKSGTSMAAPHVAGVASLLLSLNPGLSYQDLKDIIMYNVDPIASMEGITVTGGRLNAFNAMQPDNTPPAAIGDLSASELSSNSIGLEWTATGDDNTDGKACYYDIRYSLSPIDEASFDTATQINGEPRPQVSGTAEALSVNDLDCGTTYYFAVKVSDEWRNWSSVSNCVFATTMGAPVIAVDPTSLDEDLEAGDTSQQYFTIENVGLGTLDYTVSEGVNWLTAEPSSGRLLSDEEQIITVTFDATALNAGEYNTVISVESNDPVTPEVLVDVHLSVTGEPDITLSEDTIDYGPVIVGVTGYELLIVTNHGTDSLHVTGISVDNPDFSVDDTPFSLWATQNKSLNVSFTPSVPGLREGTLTFQSNDPDEPVVTVDLIGVGLEAPVISVNPAAMDEIAFAGLSLPKILTIGNTGGSDLQWTLRFKASGDPPSAMNVNLAGVKVLYDQAHGQAPSSGWSTIKADLQGRGAVISTNGSTITIALLSNYDVLWITDCERLTWQAGEIGAIADWVHGGGALLLEGDDADSMNPFNSILTQAQAGVAFNSTDGTAGTTSNVYSHETTVGINGIYVGSPEARLSSVGSPAAGLVKDVAGVWNTAYSMIQLGRVIATADELFSDGQINLADNREFANQVFDWLAAGWYDASPMSGTVPAGGSADVTVTFDAHRLFPGDCQIDIVVNSNDPATPSTTVPVDLEVRDAPDCVVSADIYRGGTPYQISETFLLGCPGGDRGDVFVVECDFDDGDMAGIPSVQPEEITMGLGDGVSFCDPNSYSTAGTPANGYKVTLVRLRISGCSGCEGGGCNPVNSGAIDVPVVYKGFELATLEGLRVKSIDVNNDGFVNLDDQAIFVQTYNKPPGDPNFNSCCDFNIDGFVNLSDFCFLGEHFYHECEQQGAPVASGYAAESEVGVKFVASNSPGGNADKLCVSVRLDNLKDVTTLAMGLGNDVPGLEYSAWIPNPAFESNCAVIPVTTGNRRFIHFAVFGTESISGNSLELGTLVYDLVPALSNAPDVGAAAPASEKNFTLAYGEILDTRNETKNIANVAYEEKAAERRNFLGDCHPNPFNPSTTIEYSVVEQTNVDIKIYNVAGQLVKQLVNEEKTPGVVYQAVWNGSNNTGAPVASGVYFYRIVAGSFTETKKMVLLK